MDQYDVTKKDAEAALKEPLSCLDEDLDELGSEEDDFKITMEDSEAVADEAKAPDYGSEVFMDDN